MSDDDRTLEFEIEVPGSPEEVWQAIATGPGISSWYVPHTIDEREGGAASASFGPGMDVPGRVAAWDPPHRIVFEGVDDGEGVEGMAFEWLVEAREGGSCVVRLINSGFGSGADWDAQYDGMAEGWPMFLTNLRLHLTHFAGQTATAMLPMAMWPGSRDDVWARLTAALGVTAAPSVGDRFAIAGSGAPALGGTVVDATPWRISLLVDTPVAGTAVIAAEGFGDQIGVSVWSYLYGDHGAAAVARDEPVWWAWLTEQGGAIG